MVDLGWIASIDNAVGQAGEQIKPVLGGFQQDPAAVRAAVVDVEAGDDGLGEKIGEQTLCRGRIGHAKASGRGAKVVW